MLWLNFAPILTVVQEKYGVSEIMANSLLLVFPIAYVILGVPAGLLIDKKGYRLVISLAAIFMSISAGLRIFDSSFWMVFAGQVGIAVSQPFIVNGISKLVADWYEKQHRALANGLGTVGLIIGMAFSMAITPALIQGTEIHNAMIIFAIITAATSLFFILVARETGASMGMATAGSWSEIGTLLKQRNLVLIFIVSFLALGFFNSFTNWIDLILAQQGFNTDQVGLIGGLMILSGIFGSAIIPSLSDVAQRRKPFLIGCGIMATILVYPLARGNNETIAIILACLFGALVLPAFALLLTMSEEDAGPEKAGAATGFLMLAGNAGTVIITVLMDKVRVEKDWLNSIYVLLVVIVLATIFAFTVRETFRKNHS